MGELWRRLLAMVRRRQLDRDLEEELRFHLEMKAGGHRAAGLSAEEARRAAQRRFGNVTLLQEDSRESWGWSALERLAQDARYALRMLAKNRALTAVAVATLALGIGANTVIFSVVHAVLLAPLPYGGTERLARLWNSNRGGNRILMSAPDANDLREQSTTLEDIAAVGYSSTDFAERGEPERVSGGRVTTNLFSVLGVRPILGRGLGAADEGPGAAPVVVLSHRLWQRRFGGDAGAIGKAITIGRVSRVIVGVMPAGFYFPSEKIEFWYPLGADRLRAVRSMRMFSVVGRLKPGATWKAAEGEMTALASRLESAYPENRGWGVAVAPLAESIVGGARPALLILSGAVTMVLLVACANVANLLLSRGVQRRQEMAVRAALGAGRRRLLRLLFLESLSLAVLGGAAGVVIAWSGTRALAPLYPPSLPRADTIGMNLPVLGFTTAISLMTAILAGLLPALRASRADVSAALKAGLASRGLRTGRARAALVVGQVAMAMVLLACAGLLLRSFLLRTQTSGFDPSNVLTVDLPSVTPARLGPMLERLRSIPGVVAAGAGSSLPYSPGMSTAVDLDGKSEIFFDAITPGYFRALRIPVRKGRTVEKEDVASAPPVMVINEAMARRYFAGENPIGKQVRVHQIKRTIVGVVGDALVGDAPPFREPRPAMYLAYLQDQASVDQLVLRTSVAPHDLAGTVKQAIRELEPKAVISMQTVEQDLSRISASPRFYLLLMAVFAGMALILAGLGVYGVVNFAVTLRTHEIGVRMALGASRGDVLRTVAWQALAMAVAGALIGGVAALGAARLLTQSSSLLYRVTPHDPITFALALAVLVASALAACWIPARRATKVDPAVALRYE